jgi:large subunit ribosomal protein L31
MKKDIHPKYYPEAQVICACGSSFTVGATKEEIRTDICSECHPFFTGEQRIVDTAGQVERFMRRLEKMEAQPEAEAETEEEGEGEDEAEAETELEEG